VSVVANVAINVDSRGAVSKLREVQAQSKQTERAFGGIAAAATKLAVAFGGIQAARFVFAKTAELESQSRSLAILAGSAQKAGQIIKELQDLGAVTPFTSTELIDSAKRLQAFGVEADKVVETTRRLADASGATGAELSGLVTAYGQVQAKGRLQGEELLQFQERGIALQEELRKMYGMTGEEFQKALEKGQISAKAVEVALVNLTSVGGKYANGAIAQSDTLQGRLSTLQDGIDGLARGIGTALSPAIKAVLNEAIFAVNAINSLIATGARAKSFGLGDSQRKQILSQAQTEAQQLVEGRRIKDPFERNRQFQELTAQRERDLIESYGYRTGQQKNSTAATMLGKSALLSKCSNNSRPLTILTLR
jgi:tape measure domain-containing protein